MTGLSIEGSGVQSLDGIEKFTSLSHLTLEGLRGVDLRALEGVPGLRYLSIGNLKPDVDLSPLERLTSVEDLLLESNNDDTDESVSALDLSRLTQLKRLQLSARMPGARLPLDLSWVPERYQLRDLYLYGCWPRGLSLEEFYDLVAAVESVYIMTTNAEDFARLVQSRPPSNVMVDTLRVSESGPEILEADGQLFIAADLASSRGFETNYDAAERLEAFLKRTAPAVASQLDWDTEADQVVVLSDDEAALHHVQTVLRADKW